MPLIAHIDLPSFQRLREEGEEILSIERARKQTIRELHIGLLNIMPDAALEATERQFFRLVGACNQIAQFRVHPFTINGLPRGPEAQAHIGKYYESFAQIRRDGLDALIISGANVTKAHLQEEIFWRPLAEVFTWARQNVTSVLCSCLATHALFQNLYGMERTRLPGKRWGVYSHKVLDRTHPLVAEINTRFDVPHSRYNEIFPDDMRRQGLKILVASQEAGVHLAVSPDGFRIVFFQGHPEYDDISLLKEYKREVLRYYHGERADYPPYPEHYFDADVREILANYQCHVQNAKQQGLTLEAMPEDLIIPHLDNTWRDSAKSVFNNWLGKIYQITNADRRLPFMSGVDPDNPLDL
ncbi:MAG: homoserine O-succinyltransferase [Methylomonas sp.]|jgi:homoserine O-succinyltransferase